uniref:Bromo domain-containing protein n=1 Tax=Anopheles dirus TaxID=7168 RepID=A0A182NUD0_9DIPT
MASSQNARQSSDWDQLIDQLQDLLKLALDGCKKAEALAACHQKRPCFKKIDSLCARLKQDLLKPDNVMSNINSQGLAWAVKDFIFVFTRIMNAWIIIKGYVSCKSEGLLSIQRELCPNFLHAFGRWHGATHELVQSLIKSFISLNKLAKSQRCGNTNIPKTDEPMSSYNDDELSNDPFDDPTEVDLATGTYYRTGIYSVEAYNRAAASAPPGFEDSLKFAARKHDIFSNDGKAPKPRSSKTGTGLKRQTVLFDTSDTLECSAQTAEPSQTSDQLHHNTATERINWLLDEVRAIEEAQYFYCITFSKNYFPDFHLVASNPLDLRAIYKRNEMGRYSVLSELLEDLRMVLRNCTQYIEASTAFDLWNPMQEQVPGHWEAIKRQEFENFPKMITFVKKMERLLDMVHAKKLRKE